MVSEAAFQLVSEAAILIAEANVEISDVFQLLYTLFIPLRSGDSSGDYCDMRIRLSDLREPAFVENLHIPYYRFWQNQALMRLRAQCPGDSSLLPFTAEAVLVNN